MRLIAVVDRSEDGLFGVAFPDAPGCVAMGATEDEAIANATDALAEWAADMRSVGRSMAARGVEAVLTDPDVREAMATGGVLVSIPLLENRGKLARANISLDEGLLASIDATAKRLGVTRSAFMAAASLEKIKATT
ncbi:MAG: type II toxin-antitoxin system HicB family antitoxin [Bauldia sp.]|nr:type II toxin-antitoxin system HicB family antitoxin [Bauldia sp.]